MTACTFKDFSSLITPPLTLNGSPDWEPEFLIEDIILKGGLNILGGADKAGKSLLRSHLLVCAVTGCPAFGVKKVVHPAKKVLLMAGEEHEKAEETRLRRAARKMGFGEGELPIHILPPSGFMFDSAGLVEGFREYIGDNGFDLVVADPFVRFHQKDENVQGQISPVLGRIRLIANDLATFLLVHHTHQPTENDSRMTLGQLLRGSSDFGAIYDHLLILKTTPGGNKRQRRLLFSPRYDEKPDPLTLEIDSAGSKEPFSFIVWKDTRSRVEEILKSGGLRLWPVKELGKAVGRDENQVRKALKELENEGLVEHGTLGWGLTSALTGGRDT